MRFRPPVVAAGSGLSSQQQHMAWPYYSSRQLELLSEWLLKAGNEVASNEFVKVQISDSPPVQEAEGVAEGKMTQGADSASTTSHETILKGRKRIKSLF
jgi:hypothetical protein